MVELIIGLTGLIGSGKTEVSTHLIKKYNFKYLSTGDIVREECVKQGLEPNRENAHAMQKTMVDKYGKDYWTNKVINTIKKNKWERAIFDGVRYNIDLELPKREFGDKFILVYVKAEQKVRFKRIKNRGRVGDPDNFEGFESQENNELKLFDFLELFEKADFLIDNSEDIPHLQNEVDALIELNL